MNDNEYFLILPLLLYGLAIADLVNSWRSYFTKERRYAPHILTGLLLLEVSFWNFYQMNHWVSPGMFTSYFTYFQLLVPPLIFLLVVSVFTPDADVTDVKGYFTKNMGIVFGGIALFVASHFLFERENMVPRLFGIGLLLIAAAWKKPSLVYLIWGFRVVTWFIAT